MKILEALAKLNPATGEHWTQNGAPAVAVVNELLGTDDITRKQITDAAPGFTKETAGDFFSPDKVAPPTEDEPKAEDTEPTEVTADAGEEAPELANEVVEPVEAELTMDDVVSLSEQELANDHDALKLNLGFLSKEIARLQRDREGIDREIDALSRRSAKLSAYVTVLVKYDPSILQRDTQKYIRQQNLNRAKRAGMAQKFIEAGTTAQDVAKAMNPRSQLDQAMKGRKPARASGRPVFHQQ